MLILKILKKKNQCFKNQTSKKLSIHDLKTEPIIELRFNRIKPESKMSLIDDLFFKTLKQKTKTHEKKI